MKHQNIILLILILLTSCSQSSDNKRLHRLIEKWQGVPIDFPKYINDVKTGEAINLTDADFTILTYVDSSGCTRCNMKLSLWKEFLNSLDSICDSDVQFLMVVHSSDIQELRYFLNGDSFNYPVYLDSENRIYDTNSFPEETILQTFLLDKNRKVIAIGNPIYSSEIAKLYKGIITGRLSVSIGTRNIISVNENRYSLGNLNPTESKSCDIIFTNHGNDTVHIEKVISSCDCTELSLSKGYIAPKSDMKAVLTFAGDTTIGDFERTIHIYFSDFEYPTTIAILGNIIQ